MFKWVILYHLIRNTVITYQYDQTEFMYQYATKKANEWKQVSPSGHFSDL